VDSGTLKVYQYTAAAGRTSGSQNASAAFALAAGDTNPQGIADPPPEDVLLTGAADPVPLSLPTALPLIAPASPGRPAVAGVTSLGGRDELFAELAQAFREEGMMPGGTPTQPPAGSTDAQGLVEHEALHTVAGFQVRLIDTYFLLDQGRNQTVFNDSSTNTLTGSDWFFDGTADRSTDVNAIDQAFILGV
jgi:hypothetical protein